jgi:class 3 adenylate cyclase
VAAVLPPASQAHSFLFADLRDYSRFADTQGDRAAAELLAAYRVLVRQEVERHSGAEIRTEGDSFYVVFPSASAAIRCGLSILAAARAASEEDPARPIHVGIGVHAGETAETAEGLVGSAVNIAARVCAL